MPTPLTDAFGTRLDPTALFDGLASFGFRDARLLVRTGDVVVEAWGPSQGEQARALATTWLVSVFSPLWRCALVERGWLADAPVPRSVVDERDPLAVVAIAELTDLGPLAEAILTDLCHRTGAPRGQVARGPLSAPRLDSEPAQTFWHPIAAVLTRALVAAELDPAEASLSVMVRDPGRRIVHGAVSHAEAPGGPHFLAWTRPGGAVGVKPACLVAGSPSLEALRAFARALRDEAGPETAELGNLLVDGLVWGVGRRPTVAVPQGTTPGPAAIAVDSDRCTSCGLCAELCPTDYLGPSGLPKTDDPTGCIRCYDCVEACPVDALRPVAAPDTAMLGTVIERRPGWLARLAGAPGPSFPGLFPPSYLLPKRPTGPPRYVLGLAVTTMQEHAAALFDEGELVGAVEEEKLCRIRHYGWAPEGRNSVTLGVDPTLSIEEALCRRSIRFLLEKAGITLDDLDVIAYNGLPARYRRAYSLCDSSRDVPLLRAGRQWFVPHHLCHAASALRPAGLEQAWILTVDGRGDRETAALFRAESGAIRRVVDILSLTDHTIGGVYETTTRLLGFGSHGQGSVMALASFGVPDDNALRPFLSIEGPTRYHLHEAGLVDAFRTLHRREGDPLDDRHRDLAASLQKALELSIEQLLRAAGVPDRPDALCLAGGVALNCQMNAVLRRAFAPGRIFVQPAANDAGTAIGAALEAWARLGRPSPWRMEHACLGPGFDDAAIEPVLRRSGLAYRRVDDIAEETARLLAQGRVVCWFQGRLEFGPRALGARSILADPRDAAVKERLNAMKGREPWRPFGPSILAGHEPEWWVDAHDSRFMLFVSEVRPERRTTIPALLHVDGTTRPQVVHREALPLYHAMLEAFHRHTGVPMLVNTSFNRRDEPIVCTPREAVDCFLGLGADGLAIGSFLVERAPRQTDPAPDEAELARLPGGRRLLLRLSVDCDCRGPHCTLRDLQGLAPRSLPEALTALAGGRRAGCDELVLMRGEVTRRCDLPEIVRRARSMGYRFVQLQSSGRPLAVEAWRRQVLQAGVDTFEIELYASTEALHDRLAGAAGAFREVTTALLGLVRAGTDVLVNVPVLSHNLRDLARVAALVRKTGVRRLQLGFPRPIELPRGLGVAEVPRLAHAAPYVRKAIQEARRLGLEVSTEAIPFCHLDETSWSTPDADEDFARYRVDDLHLGHDSLATVRPAARPEAVPCRGCDVRARCPKTWGLYQELFGTGELEPIRRAPPG
jgi:carbamoyltransferase